MVKLSPSSLGLFDDCPRCFWLDKNRKIKRPRGIFPSLPGGMDRVIKTYFDGYRKQGALPAELLGTVQGALFNDQATLERWRSWRETDLKYVDIALDAELSGALDDCVVHEGRYSPLDYKTRGSGLKEAPAFYYQDQLDCYTLMLECHGYRTNGVAYLVYYYPRVVGANGAVTFAVEPYRVTTHAEAARELLARAVGCLRQPQPPPSAPTCEYCQWLSAVQRNGNK